MTSHRGLPEGSTPASGARARIVVAVGVATVLVAAVILAVTTRQSQRVSPATTDAAPSAGHSSSSARTTSTSTPTTRATLPPTSAKVVGTAVLMVTGTGSATIIWKENGGPEHVESDVTLPWQHTIDVVEHAESEVRADAGDKSLICTIMMGDLLVAYKSGPRPVCPFAYYE